MVQTQKSTSWHNLHLVLCQRRRQGADQAEWGLLEPVLLPMSLNHDLTLPEVAAWLSRLVPGLIAIQWYFFSSSDNLNMMCKQFPAGKGFNFFFFFLMH